MKKNEYLKKIRSEETVELKNELSKLRLNFNLSIMEIKSQKSKNNSQSRKLRQKIAQLNTELNQRTTKNG